MVQQKILTGVDANGNAADGEINFNFGQSWGLGDSVGRNQYDFTSTAIHELLHTFGFLSYVDRAGANNFRDWTEFDRFIVTSDEVPVIGSNFRWNTAYNSNLTGGNRGLYFGGSHAVAANGGQLVQLYTPSPWESGSSVSHLDDDTFTGSNSQLMNALSDTGKGVRTLSPIELGVLTDLGYTVVSQSGAFGALFMIIVLVRRRKTT